MTAAQPSRLLRLGFLFASAALFWALASPLVILASRLIA